MHVGRGCHVQVLRVIECMVVYFNNIPRTYHVTKRVVLAYSVLCKKTVCAVLIVQKHK